MPPTLGDRLEHILDSIAKLQRLFADTTLDDLGKDDDRRAAAERYFEIISEASRHVPDEMKAREPQIAWRRMADLGNWLRHAYQAVDHTILWNIATVDLPPLKAFVERVVKETGS